MELVQNPTRCLRVLCGPLAGSVYPLGDRLEIGRSGKSDIQVMTAAVSRQHAVIMRGDQDDYTLVDMLSTNGTWIEEKKVTTPLELRPGDQFRIGVSAFLFDTLASEEEFETPHRARVEDATSLRSTHLEGIKPVVGGRAPPPPPPPRKWSNVPTSMQAVGLDGVEYPGNVFSDIVLYRNMRMKIARAGTLEHALRDRFERLNIGLRMPEGHDNLPVDRRAFARFACTLLPGRLGFDDRRGDGHEIQLIDIAVDGAMISVPKVPLQQGGLTWLSLPVVGGQGLRTVVFTCRIVWVRPRELGIVFSGAPTWATHNHGRDRRDTEPIQVGRIKLKRMG